MTQFQNAPEVLQGARAAFPRLRAGLRLSVTGWHIARGVCIVGAVFPRLDAAQRQARIQRWSHAVLRGLGVGVQVQGRLDAQAQMLVANHVSWLDVVVLKALYPHVRFVSKADVQHWPLIGRLAVGAGAFFVARDQPRQTGIAVDALAALLTTGETVALFPEGTTSDGHAVLPFRASLLQAALVASVPVRPMALRYADAHHAVSRSAPYIDKLTLLGSLWRTARAQGLVAHVQILAASEPAVMQRRPLAAALRSSIQAALDAETPAQAVDAANQPAWMQRDVRTAMFPLDL